MPDWSPVVEREPPTSSFFDGLLNSPHGVVGQLSRDIYGISAAEKAQNDNFARDDAASSAYATIMQRAAQLRQERPELPPEMLHKMLIQDPVFIQGAMKIPPKDMGKMVTDMTSALYPETQKPVSLAEGAKLVVPSLDQATGKYSGAQTLAENPKLHDKVETETAKLTARKQFDLLGKIHDEGESAKEQLASIGQLEQAISANPTGFFTNLRGIAASWGIPTGRGTSDLQVANAALARLTPQQRVPGSGATSDFEMKTFREALPALIKTPGANKMILGAMRAIVEDRIQRGDLANEAFAGTANAADIFSRLAKRESPLSRFQGFADPEKGAMKFESMTDTALAEAFRGTTDPQQRAAIRAEAQRRKGAR